jgi:sugar phosphate isomerase/epimerase
MRCGAMNFPVNPIVDEVAAIAGLGFDYIELTMDPPQAHYRQVLQQKTELQAALRKSRIDLICHMPTFVSLADLTDSIRAASVNEVLSSLAAAEILHAQKVVVHPAYIGGMGAFVMDLAVQHAMESLAVIVRRAMDLGLNLCLENMFPRTKFCVDVDDFKTIFKRFPHLRITLDTGHANIGSPRGKRILQFIETFPDRIGHVHVSDNFGKEDNHLPIGSGTIKFAKIIKALKQIGYDDTVTFEVFTTDREYLKTSREKFMQMWHA